MQHKLSQGPLLNDEGLLVEAGYSTNLTKEYNRDQIKAPRIKIKEWDYYYIGNQSKGIAFTIADNAYVGLASVSILDFDEKTVVTKSSIKLFTNGKLKLPNDSNRGDTLWRDNGNYLKFEARGNERYIQVRINNYKDGKPLEANFELNNTMDESIVVAIPFNKPKHFYYNQKINCIKANGYYNYNGETVYFSENDSRAVFDWGRGVWTYKNTWYWASLSTTDDEGNEIGFNLGYGFGDNTRGTENMLFYKGKSYKLLDVEFVIPKDLNNKYDYLGEWIIKSKDGAIDLRFTPILDRHDDINLILIRSLQHQVFGKFNGTIKVENKEVKFIDKISFAERLVNHW